MDTPINQASGNAGSMIHDIRNALSPLLMQAQLLSLSNPSSDAQALKNLAASIEEQIKVIIGILDKCENRGN